MSGKLKGIPAINTNPLTNTFCQKMSKNDNNICKYCYSQKMLKTFRQSCVDCFTKNGKELSEIVIPEYFLPVFNSKYVRFSAHGELINNIHLTNYINIAKKNPSTTFALWTKRKTMVQKRISEIPDNIILVYSSPEINNIIKVPKGFHKVFNVVSKDFDIDKNLINCGAKSCLNCQLCYHKNNNVNVIIERVK